MTNLPPVAARSIAEVPTPNAGRYLQQLCKHFQHKRPVSFDPRSGRIEFPIGDCRLTASEGMLNISLSAPDEAQMTQLQEVIASHLVRFAFREPPKIEWHGQSNAQT
jgi:hypothetical protein